MSRGAVDNYPAVLVPAGALDGRGRVEVFQLRPGDHDRLAAWAGMAGYPGADGGVLLLDGAAVVAQLRLGEFLVRDVDGRAIRVETDASALFTSYQPLDDQPVMGPARP